VDGFFRTRYVEEVLAALRRRAAGTVVLAVPFTPERVRRVVEEGYEAVEDVWIYHLRPSRILRLAPPDPERLTIGEMSASPSRAVLGRVALLLVSLVVTVLLLEGLLRIAVPHWRGLVPQRFMTSTAGGVLAGVPDFDGRIASLFGEFDVPVHLDGRGFRNPPDADPAAPLAFVGDSFCFGWGVQPGESFATLVATRLGVAAYNYCTVGADLLDDLDVVRAWMPPRHPGATVLTITFENDVLAYPPTAGDAGPSATVQALSRSGWSRWLMTHSALFNVAPRSPG
jgi:hypothetical protein